MQRDFRKAPLFNDDYNSRVISARSTTEPVKPKLGHLCFETLFRLIEGVWLMSGLMALVGIPITWLLPALVSLTLLFINYCPAVKH